MPAPLIAITESDEESIIPYIDAIEAAGGRWMRVNVNVPVDVDAVLRQAEGLLLTGGADVHPSWYKEEIDPAAGVRPHRNRDQNELPLAKAAIDRNMPILGICRGMQALNVLLGGRLIQDLPGHRPLPGPMGTPGSAAAKHDIFIPPGARLTSILGVGGFMKVNSVHHQGVRWAHKAPNLVVSAYSLLKDGIIEAVESPDHFWLMGVQWHPERTEEVPKVFRNLFASLVKAAGERATAPASSTNGNAER